MRRTKNVYPLLTASITIMLMLKLRCPTIEQNIPLSYPNHTNIIVYNRVPKCGSFFTRTIMKRLSLETHAYGSENSENHYECRLNDQKQNELREELLDKAKNSHYDRFVYVRHFHFVNFALEPGVTFHYINQLRDPVDQIVSGYYYNRYICMITSPTKTCTYYPPSIYQLTLDECVSTGDPARCLTKTYGAPEYLIYFCGQSSICEETTPGRTSKAALSLAKANVERHYMHIGVLEYIKNSYEILEHLQPLVFTGLVRLYAQMKHSNRTTSTPANYRHEPNNRTREVLRELLAPEYELYELVRERFIRQYSQIFDRLPSHST